MFELIPQESDSISPTRKLYATFWFKGQYLARVQKPIQVAATRPAQEVVCMRNSSRASELNAVVEKAEVARLSILLCPLLI